MEVKQIFSLLKTVWLKSRQRVSQKTEIMRARSFPNIVFYTLLPHTIKHLCSVNP